MIAAPRCCTVGMNSDSSHCWSPPTASKAGLPLDLGVEHVGVLRGRVVAPDRHLRDVGRLDAGLGGELGDGPVVVEPGHRRELPRVELLGVLLGDEAVGVGRVADDEHLHVALGAARERLALGLEDAAVRAQQVGALHALLAGHGADEQGVVDVAEGGVGVVGLHHAVQQREGAVLELHGHALEGAEGRRDLQHLEDDRLVGPEHRPAGDAEQQAVADLAGGPGDGDADGLVGHAGDPTQRRIGGSSRRHRRQLPPDSAL